MREIGVEEVLKSLPNTTIEVAIGLHPGRRLLVHKEKIPELAKKLRIVGAYAWIPVCTNCKGIVIEAPYNLLKSNIDLFLYPDSVLNHILTDLGIDLSILDEYDVYMVKWKDEKSYLVVITNSDEALNLFRKIAEILQDTSKEQVLIHEATSPVIPVDYK